MFEGHDISHHVCAYITGAEWQTRWPSWRDSLALKHGRDVTRPGALALMAGKRLLNATKLLEYSLKKACFTYIQRRDYNTSRKAKSHVDFQILYSIKSMYVRTYTKLLVLFH